MVPLKGLEPPTVSLGRNCSSIELQRLALGYTEAPPGRHVPSHRPHLAETFRHNALIQTICDGREVVFEQVGVGIERHRG